MNLKEEILSMADAARQLCYDIEALPCSEQQTAISVKASSLSHRLHQPSLLSLCVGASEAQPPEAVSPSANCSARPSAVAPKDSLISSVVPREKAEPPPLRMSGEAARIIIQNCHALLRHKFRGSPLWSLVGQITGHGSGYSHDICKSANLDPSQECGRSALYDCGGAAPCGQRAVARNND